MGNYFISDGTLRIACFSRLNLGLRECRYEYNLNNICKILLNSETLCGENFRFLVFLEKKFFKIKVRK